ncbi:MAG: hypothetical protein K5886_12965 [Lachnospiraceae bacterium]|nr:hypothetical protein [Lachnospiraceae bacterium]
MQRIFLIFLSWSAPGGLFVLLLYAMVADMALQSLQKKILIPAYDLSFDGLMDSSFASLQIGSFNVGFIAGILVYIVLVLYITNVFFKRKEPDF